MRRRDFLTLGGVAAISPLAAFAQKVPGQPVIGVLTPISSVAAARNVEALRQGLRDLGYSEGRDVTLEIRYADGAIERLPGLAADLVALKPAVIVAGSPAAALAVHDATRSIPIVMNSSPDPVALGLASSLSRPGGNVTGFWWGDETLVGKRLELLREIMPGMVRAGFMVRTGDPTSTDEIKEIPLVSGALHLEPVVLEVRGPADFEAAFATILKKQVQGLCVSSSPLFVSYRAELASLAARSRVATVYSFRDFATAGGLISYGASLSDLYRRKAGLIDKILKGANPGDLPIERPITFELLINLKAAKQLALAIPPSLLARADEVIE